MQIPPIFTLCAADAQVVTLLGGGSLRVYPFSHVQKKGFDITKPYVVWQITSGSPDNKLEGGAACSDTVETQIDVYSKDVGVNRDVVNAVENAINNDCHITSIARESYEEETKLFRSTFDATWILRRD